MREEKDALGSVFVPEDVYYGAQTERARVNFQISGETTDLYGDYIRCVAMLKKASAVTNRDLGALEEDVAGAIMQAADEVIWGKLTGQFPVNVLQGGGGTSTNMNVNEVLANRANEILTGRKGFDRVHPNDHVNMGQSTNDVIPSAVKLMSWYVLKDLLEETELLAESFLHKSQEFAGVVKLGRTCLQDAMPVTLGQEFSGYYEVTLRRANKIRSLMPECLKVPMGATAIGTGSGTVIGYQEHIGKAISDVMGENVQIEENYFDGLQNADFYTDVMHEITALALSLSKIATDFRILSSGPEDGLEEIRLPAVQPGSSIMPGKINPVMPELMNQICYDICGNNVSVIMAAEGGELDLNVWEPVMVKKIFSSGRILTAGIREFRTRCVDGITANIEQCRYYAEHSLAISSIISAVFDYRKGSEVAQRALETGKTIRETVVEMGILSAQEAEELLEARVLTDRREMAERISRYREKYNPGGNGNGK